MARIFISHSSVDNRAAIALHQWLIENNPELQDDIFLDLDEESGIRPGERWKDALRKAADRCEAVVCLLSPNWEASRECWAEFRFAEYLRKRIISARIAPLVGMDPTTAEWQQVSLIADDEVTSVDIADGVEPVNFSAAGLRRLQRGLASAGIGAETFVWPPPGDVQRAPYRGWQPLQECDAAVFFGRDAQILSALDDLGDMRRTSLESLFVVLGPSGTGKSSFLRAGLVPRLRRDDRNFALLNVVRPENDVLTAESGLATAIHAAVSSVDDRPPPLGEVKRAVVGGDATTVARWLRTYQAGRAERLLGGDDPAPTLVVPVDQAEELFGADAGAQTEIFLRMVAELTTGAADFERLDLIVLATIRTDRYQLLQTAPALAEVRTRTFTDLRPLPTTSFREVIIGPAERSTRAGRPLRIEPALVERLLADATEGADTLPLMALALGELHDDYRRFDADGRAVLQLDDYEAIGGVQHVVQTQINALLDADPDRRAHELALLREAFIPWLATVNADNGQPLRRVARWHDLPESARPVVERFIDKRLLVRDDRDGETVVEVALESLLRQWDQLAEWLAEERQDLVAADDLERTSSGWESSARDDSWLLEGARLEDAERLLTRGQFARRLVPVSEFVTESRRRHDERVDRELRAAQEHAAVLQRRSRVLRFVLAATAVFAVIALVVATVAYDATRTADRRLREATAAKLASDGLDILAGRRFGTDAQGLQEVLAAQALDPKYYRALFDAAVARAGLVTTIDTGARVNFTALNPDGMLLATNGDTSEVRLWNTTTGEQVGESLRGANGMAFSRDGRRLAVGGTKEDGPDRSIVVYDVASGAPVVRTPGIGAISTRMAYSVDGDRIVAGYTDGKARLWDAETGRLIKEFPHSTDGRVSSVALDPTAPVLATGGSDGILRLWDVNTGNLRSEQVGGDLQAGRGIDAVSYSPDGRVLASTFGGVIDLRDPRTGDLLPDAGAMTSPGLVRAVAWRPTGDGLPLISASTDGVVRLWNRWLGDPALFGKALPGQAGSVQDLAVDGDGRRVAVGSSDGTVRIWDPLVGQPVPSGPERKVGSLGVTFVPGASRGCTDDCFVVGGVYATRYDMPTGTGIGPVLDFGDVFTHDTKFGATAQQLVVGFDDRLEVWDAVSGSRTRTLLPRHGVMGNYTASSTGLVAAVEDDKALTLWDLTSPGAPPRSLATAGYPDQVEFSGDGRLLAVLEYAGAGDYSTSASLETFDARTGERRGAFALTDRTSVVAVDMTGDRVVTGGAFGAIELRDAATGVVIRSYSGHTDSVGSLAFSPDGRRMVSGGGSGLVRFWDVDSGAEIGSPFGTTESDYLSALPVSDVAFDPTGRFVVEVSDGAAIVPAASLEDTIATLCQKLTQNMGRTEWADVAPGVPYQTQCEDKPEAP